MLIFCPWWRSPTLLYNTLFLSYTNDCTPALSLALSSTFVFVRLGRHLVLSSAVVVGFEEGRRRRRALLPARLLKLLLEPSYCSEGLGVGLLPWAVRGWPLE